MLALYGAMTIRQVPSLPRSQASIVPWISRHPFVVTITTWRADPMPSRFSGRGVSPGGRGVTVQVPPGPLDAAAGADIAAVSPAAERAAAPPRASRERRVGSVTWLVYTTGCGPAMRPEGRKNPHWSGDGWGFFVRPGCPVDPAPG